jgi:hypothetical protein
MKRALDSENLVNRLELYRGRMIVYGEEEEKIAAVLSRVSVCSM